MTMPQLLLILYHRRKIVIVLTLAVMGLAMAIALLMPKTYKAGATIMLNYKGVDTLTGNATPGQAGAAYLSTHIATQMELLKSPALAQRVAAQLKLGARADVRKLYDLPDGAALTPRKAEAMLAGKLKVNVEVKPSRDTSVLNVTFSSRDAGLAAQVANAYVAAYQKFIVEIDSAPSQAADGYFKDKLVFAKEALQAAIDRKMQFQDEHAILNADGQMDVENIRLRELSTQLVTAQAQLMEANSRRSQVRNAIAAESPDVTANALIQNLKSELSKAEVKARALALRYARDHPVALAAAAEIRALKTELRQQIAVASNALANNANILQRRERELNKAVIEQKSRIVELNRSEALLSMLKKEVETAQRLYDAVSTRLAQTTLESSFDHSDVTLLTAAVKPTQAASPPLLAIFVLSAFFGLFVGVGTALACEFGKRRVRSERDLLQLYGASPLVTLGELGGGGVYYSRRPRLAHGGW